VSPFEFQRAHAHAIAVRLAGVQLKPHSLRLQHRLYVPASGMGDGGGEILGEASVREASPEVLYATRAGTSYEECAQSAVPYELEAIRIPPLTCMNPIAAGSITNTAHSSLLSSLRCIWGVRGEDFEGNAPWDSPLEGVEDISGEISGSAGAGGESLLTALTTMASGGFHLPSPSPTPNTAPRSTPATAASVHADYSAHSELTLSPYFADPCGIVEGTEEESGSGVSAVLGLPSIFVYECVFACVSHSCGWRLPGRPCLTSPTNISHVSQRTFKYHVQIHP